MTQRFLLDTSHYSHYDNDNGNNHYPGNLFPYQPKLRHLTGTFQALMQRSSYFLKWHTMTLMLSNKIAHKSLFPFSYYHFFNIIQQI